MINTNRISNIGENVSCALPVVGVVTVSVTVLLPPDVPPVYPPGVVPPEAPPGVVPGVLPGVVVGPPEQFCCIVDELAKITPELTNCVVIEQSTMLGQLAASILVVK